MLFSKEEYWKIVENFNYGEEGNIKTPVFVPITKPDMEALNKHDCVLCPEENLLLIPVDVDDAKELSYGEVKFPEGKVIDLAEWKPRIEKK